MRIQHSRRTLKDRSLEPVQIVWKRRVKLAVRVSTVDEAENAFVRARSSSLARAKAGRRRDWRRRRRYFRMDRPNFTLRSLDGRAFCFQPLRIPQGTKCLRGRAGVPP